MVKPACMTPEEYAAWSQTNGQLRVKAGSPCFDCLPTFAAEMRAVDSCDGEIQRTGTPPVYPATPHQLRLRELWRAASQRRRERARVAA